MKELNDVDQPGSSIDEYVRKLDSLLVCPPAPCIRWRVSLQTYLRTYQRPRLPRSGHQAFTFTRDRKARPLGVTQSGAPGLPPLSPCMCCTCNTASLQLLCPPPPVSASLFSALFRFRMIRCAVVHVNNSSLCVACPMRSEVVAHVMLWIRFGSSRPSMIYETSSRNSKRTCEKRKYCLAPLRP